MKIGKYGLKIGKLAISWHKNGVTTNGNGWEGFYIQFRWSIGDGDTGERML